MNLYLRKAVLEDCDLLFNWANDKIVRQNSFNQKGILYENHVKWFNKMMNFDRCSIFILCSKNVSLGQVRIEIENKTAVISYSIDKKYRGKHLAIEMLNLLEKNVGNSKVDVNKLVGYVKLDNYISQRVFEKLKYNAKIHDNFYEYYKLL
ncbi:GNAT family N-acetyltransferase [Clostridium fermenticellae]|nr:GNAT family N-acetyltransferase [Clostridium fermenticellae]